MQFFVELEIPLLFLPNPERILDFKTNVPENKAPWKIRKPYKEYWKINQEDNFDSVGIILSFKIAILTL